MFLADAIEQMGDDGIRRCNAYMLETTPRLDLADQLRMFARRSALVRQWQLFLERHPLVLCPVSGEPPFAWGMDTDSAESFGRVFHAQESQFAVPLLGLPAISVPTSVVDGLPTGVQIIGRRFREDEVLEAAQVIEHRVPPMTPIDPTF